jgi:hypothetical protein
MGFLLGYLCGIATLAVFAWYLSRTAQSKPEATDKRTVSALGMDMSGKSPHLPTLHEQLAIFKQTDGRA